MPDGNQAKKRRERTIDMMRANLVVLRWKVDILPEMQGINIEEQQKSSPDIGTRYGKLNLIWKMLLILWIANPIQRR